MINDSYNILYKIEKFLRFILYHLKMEVHYFESQITNC